MLRNLKIKAKLILMFLAIGIVSVSFTGWLGYQNAKTSITRHQFNQLTAIRETKKRQIETYFHNIRNQIITFSEDRMIISAMNQFKKAFFNIENDIEFNDKELQEYELSVKEYYQNEFLAKLKVHMASKAAWAAIEQYRPEDREDYAHYNSMLLQYLYIVNNPNPNGSKDKLEMANDGSEYSQIHSEYHPIIRNYLKKFGYYDIFLIDAETGHIVYSVFKEVDFTTNLLTGPYKDTNFAKVFKVARDASDKEFVKLVDFELYAPSYLAPASFIASPIFNGDKKLGVLIFQIPINEINRVMTGDFNWQNEGLGETGETYIVGTDHKMRNDSRFLIEEPELYSTMLEQMGTDMDMINSIKSHSTTILSQGIYTEVVDESLNGISNTKVLNNYMGRPVLSSYSPLDIEDVGWVILSEIEEKEVFSDLYILRNKIVTTMVIISLFVVLFGFLFSTSISKPINTLSNEMRDVSKGDLSKKVIIDQKDEIGMLAFSFNTMVSNLKDARDELIASKDYIEGIIKSMSDMLIVIGPDAIIESVNQATCDSLGYEREELIGKSINMLSAKAELFDRTVIKSLIGKCSIVNDEKIFISKEHKRIPTLFSAAPMYDTHGRIQGIVCLAHDITERKKAEDKMTKYHIEIEKLNYNLANVNRELEAFSYSVSHDLRAPLRSINGFSDALLEDYNDKLDAQGKNYLNRVCAASERMGFLIDDLLALSRITRSKINCEMVNLSELAHVITENLQKNEPERQTELIIAEKMFVNCDKHLLRIALQNLFDNAWKFTSRKAKARIEFGVSLMGKKMSYFVKDDGAGFDMTYINKLFTPFQRLHTTGEFEGTGIGLATVKRIINKHGGDIRAEGEVEKGATIYFTL